MPEFEMKPRLSPETRAALAAAIGVVVLLVGAAGVAVSWNRIAARYWAGRLAKGDARAVERLEKLGEAAAPALVRLVERTDPWTDNAAWFERAARLLGKTGAPADRALRAAMRRAEHDPARRARLYVMYHTAAPYLARDKGFPSPQRGVRALRALAARQEADGRWDAAKGGARGADAASDVEVTALCAFAYLGAGYYPGQKSIYADTVARALAWLEKQRGEDGRIGIGRLRDHVLAGMALGEAHGMARVEDYKSAAQRASDWTAAHGHRSGGWSDRPEQEPDVLTNVLVVTQFKSAKISGLNVEAKTFQRALNYFDSLTVKAGEDKGLVRPRPGEAPTPHSALAGAAAKLWLGSRPQDIEPERVFRKVMKRADVVIADPFDAHHAGLVFFQCPKPMWPIWRRIQRNAFGSSADGYDEETGFWRSRSPEAQRLGCVGTTALRLMAVNVRYGPASPPFLDI